MIRPKFAVPTKAQNPKSRILSDKNIWIVLAITLLSVMGAASITPALPMIAKDLAIPKESIGIVITSFSLPSVFVSPIIGMLSDRLGRKRFLVPSLFLFGLSGGLCLFARSLKIMLLLRLIQGLGAAVISTLNVTIISDLYDGKQRTEALGYYASTIAIGLGLLPVVGGALATLGWNYPFILQFTGIPVGFWAFISLNYPESRNQQSLNEYVSSSFKNLLKGKVLATFGVELITYIILYGAFFTYFPVLLAEYFSASSMAIGIIMATMSVAAVLTATQLSRIVKRIAEHDLIRLASILYGAGLLAIPFIPKMWFYIIPLATYGIAHGVNIPCIQSLVARYAPKENRAVFMSVNSVILRIGQAVGPMIMGCFYGFWGVGSVFYSGAIFCLVILLLASHISRHEV